MKKITFTCIKQNFKIYTFIKVLKIKTLLKAFFYINVCIRFDSIKDLKIINICFRPFS